MTCLLAIMILVAVGLLCFCLVAKIHEMGVFPVRALLCHVGKSRLEIYAATSLMADAWMDVGVVAAGTVLNSRVLEHLQSASLALPLKETGGG